MLATHQQYIRRYISMDFCSLFLIAKYYQEINKRKKLASNFCERTVFRKEMFDNKNFKEFSSVKDQPMFRNMNKIICRLARLGT